MRDETAPTPTPSVRIEGPPPGLPSGKHDVPKWAIGALGGALLTVGVVYMLVRFIRARRA